MRPNDSDRPRFDTAWVEAYAGLDLEQIQARADGHLPSHGGRYEHRTLSRAQVEALACELYDWRRHADDPTSYWLGSHQVAELLGVSRQRLGQLGDKGFVPFVRHRDGVRLYRREQLLTIANAREARWR